MKQRLLQLLFLLCSLLAGQTTTQAQNTYKLVTNISELSSGDKIIIASGTNGSCYAIGAANNANNRKAAGITSYDGLISTAVDNANETTSGANTLNAALTNPLEITLVSYDSKWKLRDKLSDGNVYLNGGYNKSGNKNYLNADTFAEEGKNASNGIWSISINTTTYEATINNQNNFKIRQYDAVIPLFASYSSGEKAVYIYKKVAPVSITVSSASYATIASDFPLNFTDAGIKAYIAEADGTTGVSFTQVNKVPANTGVLLYYDGGTTESVPVFDGSDADDVSTNVFKVGTGAALASNEGNLHNYILNNVGGNIGFYMAAGQTVATNRAYIQIDESAGVKEFININFNELVDEVDDVRGKMKDARGNVYNIVGQRVGNAQFKQRLKHGIYIVNGKKVII